MNAQGRFASTIVLMLVFALFASIVSSPAGVKAQTPTVVAATHKVMPYPASQNAKDKYDIFCPNFHRIKMPGMDVLYLKYSDEGDTMTDISLSLDRFVVTRGDNDVPLVRPLPADGVLERWELILSPAARDKNAKCLPEFSPVQ